MATSTASVFATAARNRSLLRLELAFAGFNAAEFGVWIALLVYAYAEGGAAAASVVALVQLIPAAILAPFIGALGDRFRAGRVLLVGYAVIALAQAAVAVAMYMDAPVWTVFALAPFVNLGITVPRPAQSALLPGIVFTPLELTAANVVSGWMENGSVLIAPALGGVLLGIGGPELTIGVLAVIAGISTLLVLPIAGPPPMGRSEEESLSLLGQVRHGIKAVSREPAVRLLVGILGSMYVLVGALDILYVVLAIDVLALGEAYAGYLNAAFGAGGVIGVALTVLLVARRRLTPALIAGVLAAALSLGVLGLYPTEIGAFVLLAAAGVGRTVCDVTGRILLQRSAPPAVLAEVFALLESLMNVGLAIGSVLVPVLVGLSGARAALLGTAILFLLLAAVVWRGLRAVDAAADVPQVEIQLLKSIPLFSPLPAPELEGLARALEHVVVPGGETVIREGDAGDRFYAIADGEVEVRKAGRGVARLRRGEGFGEIALIHDCCRTATVTAIVPTQLYALEKDPFITAVTGHAPVTRVADEVIAKRLEELQEYAVPDAGERVPV